LAGRWKTRYQKKRKKNPWYHLPKNNSL